jgi:hypothetical protein
MISVLCAVVIAFGLSFVVPLFVSRYLIFTIPALYLLIASMADVYAPRFALVRWALVALMFATLVSEIASPTTPVKEELSGCGRVY